jgi:hypothetical protein
MNLKFSAGRILASREVRGNREVVGVLAVSHAVVVRSCSRFELDDGGA